VQRLRILAIVVENQSSGTPSTTEQRADQHTYPKGYAHSQQGPLSNRPFDPRPQGCVQLIQQLLQLLFQRIKAVGQMTSTFSR
jgi:hypothetical protein